MAIKIYEKFAPRANPADGDYPYGSIKNESVPGAKDGTPLDAAWGNDYAGFDAALFAEAGVVPSGNPDTAVDSQRLDAIKKIGGRRPTTVAEIATGVFKVGDRLEVTDRANAPFDVVAGGSVNGFNILSAGSGKVAVLVESMVTKVSSIYNGPQTLPVFLEIMGSREYGGVLEIDIPITSDPFVLPSWVTIKGSRKEDGWSRSETPSEYKTPFKITLSDGANDWLCCVLEGTKNWGIQDVTLDGNSDGQTSYNSGCIKAKYVGSTRAFGGIISGVKCLFPKGWSGYIQGGPLSITDTFFMSGCLFVDASDTKVNNVDFDGTGGLHTPLCVVNSNSLESWSNIFAFGWGEVSPIKNVQEVTGTVTTSGNITLSVDAWLYDGAPVVCSTTLPSSKPYNVYFAFKNGSVWELYNYPKENAKAVKATFAVAGSITLSHGGKESGAYFSGVFRMGLSNARFGGNTGQGLVMADCNRNTVSHVHTFNNNLRGIGSSSIELLDSTRNRFSLCQFGEVSGGVASAVTLNQSASQLCTFNVFDETCGLTGNSTGIDVQDNTTQPYQNRNRFYIQPQADGQINYVSVNKDKEPELCMAQVLVTADQAITASVNNTVSLTQRYANGMSVTGGNNILIPVTKGGVYRVEGRLGFNADLTSQMLVKVEGISGQTGSLGLRMYSDDRTQSFEVEFRSTSDVPVNLVLTVFTTQTGLSLLSSPDYSWITCRKVADSKFDGTIQA